MIHLEQGQSLKEEPKVRVAVATGDYNETDLIECVRDGEDLSEPTCMYQAQYIAFGNPVYQQSEELTEDQVSALIANIPPHEVINNRKLIDNKKPAAKFSGQIIQRKGPVGKKELRRDLAEEQMPVNKKTATTTEPIINQNIQQATSTNQISTSTPVNNSNNASSTPNQTANVLDSINQNATSTSTTTPNIGDLSTTTPAIGGDIGTTTPDIIPNTGTSTPLIGQDLGTTTPQILNGNASTTPDANYNPTTTTPEINNNLSTTTPGVTPAVGPQYPIAEPIPTPEPQIPAGNVPENNVAQDIVAYAKKRIIKKLRI